MILIMFQGLKVMMNRKTKYIKMHLHGNTSVPSAQCCSIVITLQMVTWNKR